MNKTKIFLAISLAAAFGLSACGDDSSSGPNFEGAESSSSVLAESSAANAESSSSNVAESSNANVTSSNSEGAILNCYETERNTITTPVRCDNGKYFETKSEFVDFFRSETSKNPSTKFNCTDHGTICYDKLGIDGQVTGGCVPDIKCPAKYEDESSSSANVAGSSATIASSSSVNATANSSANVAYSSSSESVINCYEYDYMDNTNRCTAGTRCIERTFRCDNGKNFDDMKKFAEYVHDERISNPLFASNCGKVIDICIDGENFGDCDPAEIECPIRTEESSSSAAVESSSSAEHFWWQDPCNIEGEQKSEDFGNVIDTYECVKGEWKITNKHFPNCAPNTDCVMEDLMNTCKTNGIVGTACVIDKVDYGHKNVNGCDYFCYDGKWEYLPPPAALPSSN